MTESGLIATDLPCPKCGYNLRGLSEYRCPECGEQYDPALLSQSRLPWTYRSHVGWYRSYLKTAWIVARKPRGLSPELARDVDYRDSQTFRWVSVLHAYVPLLSFLLWTPFLREPWSAAGFLIATLCALLALTGAPSYLFHPKRLSIEAQNRAVAMSYYASGPLAFTPVGLVLAVLLGGNAAPLLLTLFFGAELLLWGQALITWGFAVRRLNGCSHSLAPVLAPLLGFVAAVAAFLLLSGLVSYLGLVFYSVQVELRPPAP